MVGVLVSGALCGWMAETVGWESVFWLAGGINLLLCPFWIFMVRNSPKEHPWLSAYEEKILESTKHIKVQVLFLLLFCDQCT